MGAIGNRRFTKDEYKQLRAILVEESKVMMKRPGYIIGHILMAGLLLYFLVRAFGPESWEALEWPTTGDIIGIAAGAAVGAFVYWVLLKLLSAKGGSKFFLIFFFIWMAAFGLFTIGQGPEGWINWEFAIYAVVTLFGWGFCTDSIKEYFCEKIFTARKEGKQA